MKLLSLIFVPVMRKLLGGSAGYSVFASANEVFAFVYVLTTAGLPVAISKLVTELTAVGNLRQARQAFRMARSVMLLMGILFTILLAAFAKPIAAVMNNAESWMGILFIAPTILICSILSAYRGYLQGLKNMTPTAVSQVAEQFVHVAVSIGMVILLRDQGIIWAVAGASSGTAAGALVALLIVLRFYKRQEAELHVRVKSPVRNESRMTAKAILRKLIYYSIPITISSGIQYGGNMVDASILLGRLEAGGFEKEVAKGLYGDMMATRQLLNVPASLVTALCISLLPTVAALYAQQKKQETVDKINYCYKLCFLVAVPCAVALTVFSGPVYTLLGFGENHMLLCYMAFSIILMAIVHLQSTVMQSVNRLFTATVFMGISVVVKAVLNYILVAVPGLNVYGAILSTYISYLIPLCLNYYVLTRKMHLKISLFRHLSSPGLAAGLMTAAAVPVFLLLQRLFGGISVAYIANALALLPAAFVGAAVYFLSLRKLGGLTDEDHKAIYPRALRGRTASRGVEE